MSARDLSKLRVGSAWLGVVEMRDGDDILTFTPPPGVTPLTEAEYEAIMVKIIVADLRRRAVLSEYLERAEAANLARASLALS